MRFKDTQFGKIPAHWNVATIDSVTQTVTDYVANGSFASLAENVQYREEEDYAVLIRLVDYNNNFSGNFVYIDKTAYNFLKKSKLYGGEIIISNVGNVGTVFRCPFLNKPMSLAPNSIMVKFNGCDDFYYYWLQSPSGQYMLHSIVTGSAQPKFNKTNFKGMKVPVPPIDEQKKIAIFFNQIDEKIAINRKINQNLEQQAQAIFKEKFINNYDNTWQHGTFSNIINYMINGDWGKEKLTGNYTEEVFCIRGADIPEVRNGNKGKMPIRYILPKNYLAKHLVPGDIVVEVSGGSPTQSTGRATIITDSLLNRYDRGMVCTNFCKALKPYEDYSLFAYHYWQYLYDQGIFFSYENGTTGIKNLDISGIIENEPIIIPPKEFILKFNNTCNTFYNKIYANSHESERLTQLRDTLLPKIMSGELDVSNIDI